MRKRDVLAALYPERRIAGFSRNDQRITFFNQVNALIRPEMSVLDYGAGRGKWAELEEGYKLALTTLRGKCRRVVGVDVDEAVLENRLVDESFVTNGTDPLPFEDESFDLILSWAVFEHISNPEFAAAELTRILKPGGWICAWTPSKWSYFAICARFVPQEHHAPLVKWMGSRRRGEEDVFPTVYKMNTLRAIDRLFPRATYENCSYYYNGPPAYHANRWLLAAAWRFWMWLLPPMFAQQMHIFLRKKSVTAED